MSDKTLITYFEVSLNIRKREKLSNVILHENLWRKSKKMREEENYVVKLLYYIIIHTSS